MDAPNIPIIKRNFSRMLKLVVAAFFYLVILPAHWLLSIFGFRLAIMELSLIIAKGVKGGRRAFRVYTPTVRDIFVCTFPKSGTNWMMQIAHQSIFHGADDYENIHDVVSWPDMSGGLVRSISLQSSLVQQSSPEHKRVIKTHLSAEHVPYNEKAHYLTVLRDPKEIFVSSYYFGLGCYGPLMPDVDYWFDLFLTEDFPMNFGSTWAEHTASYWKLRDKPNVLILFFGEMVEDLQGSVQNVVEFLGVPLTASELQQVIEKSSFAYMSKIDQKFLHMPKENMPWKSNVKMIRAGKKGNSQELLSPEKQALIDNHFSNELKTLNSDFPYEQYFNRDDNNMRMSPNQL